MLGPIGNDILDIGSRKAVMARTAANAADPFGLGRPGQFEVPNVMDVRFYCCYKRIPGLRFVLFCSVVVHHLP